MRSAVSWVLAVGMNRLLTTYLLVGKTNSSEVFSLPDTKEHTRAGDRAQDLRDRPSRRRGANGELVPCASLARLRLVRSQPRGDPGGRIDSRARRDGPEPGGDVLR